MRFSRFQQFRFGFYGARTRTHQGTLLARLSDRSFKRNRFFTAGVATGLCGIALYNLSDHKCKCDSIEGINFAIKPIEDVVIHQEEVEKVIKTSESDNSEPPTILQLVWEMIKENPLLTIGSIVFGVLNQMIPLFFPWGIGMFLDLARTKTNTKDLLLPAIGLIGFGLFSAVIDFIQYSFLSRLCAKLQTILTKELFWSFLKQDMSFFDQLQTSELISRLDSDIDLIVGTFKHLISRGLSCSVSLVGGAISLYFMSQKLSYVMFAAIPTMVGIGAFYTRFLRKLSFLVRSDHGKVISNANETFSLIRTVRVFAGEEVQMEKFSEVLEKEQASSIEFGNGIGIFKGLSSLGLSGVMALVLGYGGHLVLSDQMTVGLMSGFLHQSLRMQQNLGELSILGGEVGRSLGAIQRLNNLLYRIPLIPLKGGLVIESGMRGDIEFSEVSFAYPTRPTQMIVNQLSFSIPSGKVYALVGPSGSGKSTLISLIERLYDPNYGSVCVDGFDLRSLDVSWLHKQIGIVNQEPVLFDTSIFENIRYGNPHATPEQVMYAAKQANCHQFINLFPSRYDTKVGERGVQLSGGQKQRIAIARALLKNPKILILDEATSALDSESEGLVQEALAHAMKDRTVLIVAHRLSTVKNADCILVMKNGQVVERGTHSELIRSNGIYASQVANQMQGFYEAQQE